MDTSYANVEVLGAHRESDNAAAWTPRDVLLEMLRMIDAGEAAPDVLVLCFSETTAPGVRKTAFRQSSPDNLVSLGLLARASHLISG